MIKVELNTIEEYAMLLEECFGMEGVMALAWYAMFAHRRELAKRHYGIPLLIVEGHPGMGKTELALAIAAIDVPEGLDDKVALHILPSITNEKVRGLMNGLADFTVMESQQFGVPEKVVKPLLERITSDPMVMVTSYGHNENGPLADECVIIRLPNRKFSSDELMSLYTLHQAMNTAKKLRPLFYKEMAELQMTAWRERLEAEAEKIGLDAEAGHSHRIICFYALILSHWQGMGFSGEYMTERLFDYAVSSLCVRLPRKKEPTRGMMQLHRAKDETMTVTLRQPDGHRQRIRFANEQMLRTFVRMLRMMDDMNAASVEVSI